MGRSCGLRLTFSASFAESEHDPGPSPRSGSTQVVPLLRDLLLAILSKCSRPHSVSREQHKHQDYTQHDQH